MIELAHGYTLEEVPFTPGWNVLKEDRMKNFLAFTPENSEAERQRILRAHATHLFEIAEYRKQNFDTICSHDHDRIDREGGICDAAIDWFSERGKEYLQQKDLTGLSAGIVFYSADVGAVFVSPNETSEGTPQRLLSRAIAKKLNLGLGGRLMHADIPSFKLIQLNKVPSGVVALHDIDFSFEPGKKETSPSYDLASAAGG